MRAAERVVVIGAGPCGLGIAQQLKHEQVIDALVVDRADAPAAAWRNHYDGFRLNTCAFWSHLPGQRIPRRLGRWPERDDLVRYFDDYVQRQHLRRAFDVVVHRPDREGECWRIETNGGVLTAEAVVVATGNYHTPVFPSWDGVAGFTEPLIGPLRSFRTQASPIAADIDGYLDAAN